MYSVIHTHERDEVQTKQMWLSGETQKKKEKCHRIIMHCSFHLSLLTLWLNVCFIDQKLGEIRESSMATEDWAAMEDEEFLGEYMDTSSIEVDQIDNNRLPNDHAIYSNDEMTTSPVNQKWSNHQADLVSSQSTSREGEGRQKKVNKMKLLVRSHALREAASPPPDSPSPLFNATNNGSSPEEQQHNQQASLVITVVESNDETSSLHQQEIAPNRLRPRVQVDLLHF